MPIFEFRCLNCNHEFEKLVLNPKSAGDEITCPQCQSNKVTRLLSGFQARSRTEGGESRSLSSGCSTCSASSCVGCK